MRRRLRVLAVLGLVFGCCVSTGGVTCGMKTKASMLERTAGYRRQHRDRAERVWPKFDADQAKLGGLEELRRPWKGADASVLLSPLVKWEGDVRFRPVLDRYQAEHGKPKLELSMALREAIAHGGLDRFDPRELPDLAWMARLGEFDHWNLAANGPLLDWQPQSGMDINMLFGMPLPDFSALRWAAQLRIATARPKEEATVRREIHQLGVLLWRTDTLAGEAEALKLWRLEDAYDDETLAALERVAWGATGFSALWTPQDVKEPRAASSVLGGCAGIRESANLYVLVRPLVGADYPDEYRWLDAQFDGGGCDLSERASLWTLTKDGAPDDYYRYLAGNDVRDGGREDGTLAFRALLALPPSHQPLGETLLAIATITGFDRYEPDAGASVRPGSRAR